MILRKKGFSIYLRILGYVKPYWASLTGSIIAVLFFVIFSSISLFSIMPFLSTLFGVKGSVSVDARAPAEQTLRDTVPIPGGGFDVKEKVYTLFLGKDWHKNRLKSLYRACLLLLFFMFWKNFFEYVQKYLMSYAEEGILKDIRNDIYRHLSFLSLGYFSKTRTGQLISRITNDVNLVNGGISAGFFTLIKNPLLIIASLAIAFYLSWQLTLISLVIMPLSMAILSYIGVKLRKGSTVSQERMADVTSVLQETIAGMRVVKAFAMEEFETQKFMRETQKYFKTLVQLIRARNLASPLTEFLGATIAVGILFFGGMKVLQGNILAPEEFIMFLMVIFSIMQPIKEISSVNNKIQEAIAAGQRIFDLIDTPPEVQDSTDAKPVRGFAQSVVFKNVSFGYKTSERVLDAVNLTVRKGQVFAIVGRSGAGKSTLVDMLPRFYDPQEGSIEIDGRDIRSMKLKDLRALFGIVTQETILFNDSVRNNIAYGLGEIPFQKIMRAAYAANAHHFIEKMEHGYDTTIGERGVMISGGERQRLAIARAILKDAPILILDEATSALDTQSEVLVQEAMERLMKDRTSFVIAHRLSTILHADEIVVLDRGSIVERGSHHVLLAREGVYKRLYDMQFRDSYRNS